MIKEKNIKINDIFKENNDGRIFFNNEYIGDYIDKKLILKNIRTDVIFKFEQPDMVNYKLEDVYNYEKKHHNSIKYFKRSNLKEKYHFEYNCHVGDVLIKCESKEVNLSLQDYLANNWEVYLNTGFIDE